MNRKVGEGQVFKQKKNLFDFKNSLKIPKG